MNFWKTTLISAFAFVGIGSTVLFTACEQDACLDLKCKNGGTCTDGFCRCPAGFEGTECEYQAVSKFVGRYQGTSRCNQQPPFFDSVVVYVAKSPNVLGVIRYSTTLLGDTILTNVDADGTSATFNGAPNNRSVRVSYESTTNRLTLDVQEKINNNAMNCVFNGTK